MQEKNIKKSFELQEKINNELEKFDNENLFILFLLSKSQGYTA